jgi:flagellar basal-body rod protein FlgC
MDIISQNIANSDTAETENGEPYIRKTAVMQERKGTKSFSDVLGIKGKLRSGEGVEVTAVEEDESAFKLVYEPENPAADESGYVRYPNIDMVKEMMDMMSATRAYQADITVINAVKTMAASALKIGK